MAIAHANPCKFKLALKKKYSQNKKIFPGPSSIGLASMGRVLLGVILF